MLYSVVIPVFNSEKCLNELTERLNNVFLAYKWDWEVIFVDDKSRDNSLKVLKDIAQKLNNVVCVELRKNYGQHNAILAGFKYVRGDYIITMDDDLQNPPEEIPKLVNAIMESDKDIIFAKFEQKKHSLYRKIGSKIVSRLNEKIFSKPKNLVLSNFRIIKKSIIEDVITYNIPNPYLPGLLLTVTSNCGNVATKHCQRQYGKSNYSIKRIMKLIFSLVFMFSDYSLRFAIGIGLFFSIIGFLFSAFVVAKNLLHGVTIQGWTSTVLVISLFSSINLLVMGIIGRYLNIVLKTVSGEKQYIIKEKSI